MKSKIGLDEVGAKGAGANRHASNNATEYNGIMAQIQAKQS
jgi:hypothetical protein